MAQAWKVRVALLAVALFGLLLFNSQLYALALFNYAHLERLHGRNNPQLFQEALAHFPDNDHLRRHAGASLLEAGDPAQAAVLLRPLAGAATLDPNVLNLLLAALAGSGQEQEAVQLYMRGPTLPRLPADLAAQMLLARRASAPAAGLAQAPYPTLLAAAIGYLGDEPAFELIKARLSDNNFWLTETGKSVYNTLGWKAQKPAVASTLHNDTWTWSLMSTGDPWNRAVFVLGLDEVTGPVDKLALRIDGLAIESLATREAARAGFQHKPIALTAGQAYQISFAYRTLGNTATAGLWVSTDPLVLWEGEQFLPSTGGKWRKVEITAAHRGTKAATVAPLLRSWGLGSVWYAGFTLRPVSGGTDGLSAGPTVRITDLSGP